MRNLTNLLVRALVAGAMTATAASAQINIVGTTTGSFTAGDGCSVNGSGALVCGTSSLQFFGANINVMAFPGGIVGTTPVATIGGAPVAGTNNNNFGAFLFTGSPNLQAFSGTFTLGLTFTAPQAGAATETATVVGNIADMGGSLAVTFTDFVSESSNNLVNYDAVVGTSIRYFINDTNIQTPSNGNTSLTSVNGAIAVVPEPSTYLLMGSGLLGLAGIARRRRTA
jgi:hypothetical protein